ncbi:MAG TPA: glycosyl hydrolase family 8, partial [Fibrobacteraceae bacterium]|nr:glycosyl hydrolase family 8 [Fibrobacteraceae bacterium]
MTSAILDALLQPGEHPKIYYTQMNKRHPPKFWRTGVLFTILCLLGLVSCMTDDAASGTESPSSSFTTPLSSSNLSSSTNPLSSVTDLFSSAITSSATDDFSSSVITLSSSSDLSSSMIPISSSGGVLLSSQDEGLSTTRFSLENSSQSTVSSSSVADSSCLFPTTAESAVASSMYSLWKAAYVRDSTYGSEILSRVMWDSDSNYTVSEAIGYGMLIAYFQEDWTTFNQFWNYAKNVRSYNASDLTPWEMIGFDSAFISSSETDADMDIATALILAYKKTGTSAYLSDALTLINGIWDEEINSTNFLIRPGDDITLWDDESYGPSYNPSYFSPVAIRLFAELDANHDWLSVLSANYSWLEKVQGEENGFFKDWAGFNGSAQSPGVRISTYKYHNLESIRIPWRMTWDYLWYNDSRAYAMMNRLSSYSISLANGDPDSLGCRLINSETGTWAHAVSGNEV